VNARITRSQSETSKRSMDKECVLAGSPTKRGRFAE
jgi:hypothetical protein